MADTPQFLTLAGNRDRSERYVRPLLEPEPLILVEDGKVIERKLRKERMTPEDIAGEARLQQIDSLEKVKWAVLESGGRISFIPR